MTTTATRASGTTDWAGSPLSTLHPLATQLPSVPVEHYADGESYVVRLAIPGADQAHGLTIALEAGMLTVRIAMKPEHEHGGKIEVKIEP